MELTSNISNPRTPKAAVVPTLAESVGGRSMPRSSRAIAASGCNRWNVVAAIITGSSEVKACAARVIALSTNPTSRISNEIRDARRRLGVTVTHTFMRSRVSL
ncbi:hypothetical protein [Rhodococcus sp. IEGM 1379]|uniref:hypothetical protein n=1 Tax=Rhodococcus sp. IEGM 1379 TaxID=3047086 RepID=UPI0024B75631|nr:hypothetical protein [Rhodococcus sp. IEGM 1379]MDI9916570.1 hypothetical protein [Rhodococcus sp. IEGM 1379]